MTDAQKNEAVKLFEEGKLLRMDEYLLFEKRMCDKYGLSPKSIFRDKYVLFRQ